MSATATTSGADREVIARACERHNLTFNQSRTRERSGQHWSEWFPPECPECEQETTERMRRETAEQKFNDEVLPVIKAEVIAESDKRCSEEADHAERIAAIADSQMPEVFREWWAANRAGFIARADSEYRAQIDAQIIAERRGAFIEEQRQAAAKADEELRGKLAAERDESARAALSRWAAF
jgi:hypothetical protein